jgi:surface antigen
MKKIVTVLLALLCSVTLVGCQNNQDTGTLAGAVAGGLLGSTVGGGSGKVLAIAAGTIAGAVIGGSIGKSMDDADRMRMNQALENNRPGQPAYWRNADTGTAYEVVPTKNVSYEGNDYCREYRTTANIGGKKQNMYGTACRQPDGSWKAVS